MLCVNGHISGSTTIQSAKLASIHPNVQYTDSTYNRHRRYTYTKVNDGSTPAAASSAESPVASTAVSIDESPIASPKSPVESVPVESPIASAPTQKQQQQSVKVPQAPKASVVAPLSNAPIYVPAPSPIIHSVIHSVKVQSTRHEAPVPSPYTPIPSSGVTAPSPDVAVASFGVTAPSPDYQVQSGGITTPSPDVALPSDGIQTAPSPNEPYRPVAYPTVETARPLRKRHNSAAKYAASSLAPIASIAPIASGVASLASLAPLAM